MLYAGLAQVRVELIDRFGGWDGALKAIMNAQGRTPRGVHPAVLAVSGPDYAAELRKRGFSLTESWLE
jgi:hypothetical protein